MDPITSRKAEEDRIKAEAALAMTFGQCAEAFLAANEVSWRNPKHRQQWRSTLKAYVYPSLGSLPVQAVDAPSILKVLHPIWIDKPETASRVRGRIEAVLDYPVVDRRKS